MGHHKWNKWSISSKSPSGKVPIKKKIKKLGEKRHIWISCLLLLCCFCLKNAYTVCSYNWESRSYKFSTLHPSYLSPHRLNGCSRTGYTPSFPVLLHSPLCSYQINHPTSGDSAGKHGLKIRFMLVWRQNSEPAAITSNSISVLQSTIGFNWHTFCIHFNEHHMPENLSWKFKRHFMLNACKPLLMMNSGKVHSHVLCWQNFSWGQAVMHISESNHRYR